MTRGWVCRLQLLLVLASAVVLRSESRGTHDILLSQIRDSPNLKGQVPVFVSPRKRVGRLYPQALGSLFIAYGDTCTKPVNITRRYAWLLRNVGRAHASAT
jgi:hypothetical protein